MRSKAPLALMEQLIMVLVFAVAGALCLRLFVSADKMSENSMALDSAVIQAQTAAEILKSGAPEQNFEKYGAEYSDGGWRIGFDENWNAVSGNENAEYSLVAAYEDAESEYMWFAKVSVFTADGELIFEIPVSGQLYGGGERA